MALAGFHQLHVSPLIFYLWFLFLPYHTPKTPKNQKDHLNQEDHLNEEDAHLCRFNNI